jgi:hypothetical protein
LKNIASMVALFLIHGDQSHGAVLPIPINWTCFDRVPSR